MKKLVRQNKERGASLVEYALLVALIAIVCAAVVKLTGEEVKKPITKVATELSSGGANLPCYSGSPNWPACSEQ